MTTDPIESPVNDKAQAKADKAYKKASRPFYKKKRFIILAFFLVVAVFSSMSGGGDSSTSSDEGSSTVQSEEVAPKEVALKVTAAKLLQDLKDNALSASTKYDDKLVTVTGKLYNIDASGDYFSLAGTEFSFINIQIYIDDSFLETVSGFKNGQAVTVTGKVTGVGEIMGYSIDAISIP
jgi:hypothetical protein